MKDLSGHSPSEIIQMLIDGELSISESKKFSDMVNSNPELKKEFNDYKKIKESINSDKKQQLESSVPASALKNNIFKELGLGKAVETPVAIGGGSRLLQYGSATLTSTLSWLTNYKVSVPSLAMVTAFTFFALWNNGDKINTNNNSNKVNSNTETLAKSKDTKNIPIVSSNSGQSNSTNNDMFENKLTNNKLENSKENSKLSERIAESNSKTKNSLKVNSKLETKQTSINEIKTETDKSKLTASIIKDNTEELNNDNSNTLKDISTLLLVENGIVHNSYSLSELRNSKNKPNPNFNVITPLKSKYNNTYENNNFGVTVLFTGMNQLNNNEFALSGYFVNINTTKNYIIEGGVEFNRIFLSPLDKVGNSGKFDGVGLTARFQSNGILNEFIGKTFGEIVNPYAGISFGQVNPGLYSKVNAGVQLNLVPIGNFNIGITAGYEYFGLLQQSSQFQSSRQGLVSGILVKF